MQRFVRSRGWFSVLMLLVTLPAVLSVAPFVEARLFPIVVEARVVAERAGSDILVSARLDKRRGCLVEAAVNDYKPHDGPAGPILTSGTFNRSTGGDTYLTRRFFFPGAYPGPGTLRRKIWYRCHPLWLTPQPLTPLEMR